MKSLCRVFGWGMDQGQSHTHAVEEMSPSPESQRWNREGLLGECAMPDLGAETKGTCLPEGIQCSEFFRAALLVASHRGPLAAFTKRSLVPFRTDARPT